MQQRVARARAALHRAGRRNTEQREGILRCLAAMPRHFGAEEALRALRESRCPPAVSRATLYRLLGELERLGVLRRVLLSEGHTHYEFAEDRDQHQHVVCAHCQEVTEVSSPALERVVRRLCTERGLSWLGVEVEITVLCGSCRARLRAGEEVKEA